MDTSSGDHAGARSAHDLAALNAARPTALAAARRLVEVIPSDAVTPQELAAVADEAVRAITLLWESASRVARPW